MLNPMLSRFLIITNCTYFHFTVARVGCFKDKRNRAFPKRHRMKFSRDPYTFIDRVKECRDKVDSMGEDYEVQ